MPDRTKAAQRGRTTPKQSPKGGRYTPPIPREVRRSPRWYPWVLITLLVLGIATIILNYVGALPGSPANWYTLGAILAILVAALAATRYH
jgi:quinol-cytochrome oxidoreductase complex cytochrome b subunit